jgi:hypothetical protein
MIPSLCQYELQAFQAVETIAILERKLICVKKMLLENPDNTFLLRELSLVELDMTITVNELEHIEDMIRQFHDVQPQIPNSSSFQQASLQRQR